MMLSSSRKIREPSLFDSLIPILFLIILLSLSVYIFGSDSSFGPNQISLVFAASIAAAIGWKNGYQWDHIQTGITQAIHTAMGAILILLSVGMLIGTWMLSGTVPALLVYGLEVISPTWFYVSCCFVCAIVAISIGSSWSTVGTIGVGFIGISYSLGLDPNITAGAIISGAYMGDKMSPLSDTTNLAPSVAGSELFAHIRHMTWTTIPAFIISLILFTFLGLTETISTDMDKIAIITDAIESEFSIGLHLLIPLLVLLALAKAKVAALPSVLIGAFVGMIFSVIFQQETILKMVGDAQGLSTPLVLLKGVWTTTFDGYNSTADSETVRVLLSKGGMSSMLNTVWLILCALTFGGVMESVGLLKKLVDYVLRHVQSAQGLIASTLATAFAVNVIASDQYMAVVLPGRAFKEEYKRRGLDPLNLSRAIEDAGTVTSVLIPWNTCGAFMAVTLGVQTLDYLPYAFFNILSPIIGLIFALTMYKVIMLKKTIGVN
ncbi:MAG: NhaC family Na+:H+ antiporter [Psychromonas sp.]|jgi:NhaC family Na+:H+ antiporter